MLIAGIAGIAALAVGVVVALAGSAVVGTQIRTVQDPNTAGATKEATAATATAALVAAGIGAVGAGTGAVLLAVHF